MCKYNIRSSFNQDLLIYHLFFEKKRMRKNLHIICAAICMSDYVSIEGNNYRSKIHNYLNVENYLIYLKYII